jgi:glyoxylase-like metal-dependent hydrolase (beta-lactamase superfamily II)
MLQLREGIWRWEARHPSWSEDDGGPDGWGPEVASYAVETRERLLLVDPLSVPAEAEELAAGRETAIVLTCPWHQRDARALGERLGAPIFVPPPDEGEQDPVPGTVFAAGDRLPGGVKALPGLEPNDLVLWIEDLRALVLGDTLVDRGEGLEIPLTWLRDVTLAEVLATLRPLLDLPVELVLPTHGPPADRAALVRAIS